MFLPGRPTDAPLTVATGLVLRTLSSVDVFQLTSPDFKACPFFRDTSAHCDWRLTKMLMMPVLSARPCRRNPIDSRASAIHGRVSAAHGRSAPCAIMDDPFLSTRMDPQCSGSLLVPLFLACFFSPLDARTTTVERAVARRTPCRRYQRPMQVVSGTHLFPLVS